VDKRTLSEKKRQERKKEYLTCAPESICGGMIGRQFGRNSASSRGWLPKRIPLGVWGEGGTVDVGKAINLQSTRREKGNKAETSKRKRGSLPVKGVMRGRKLEAGKGQGGVFRPPKKGDAKQKKASRMRLLGFEQLETEEDKRGRGLDQKKQNGPKMERGVKEGVGKTWGDTESAFSRNQG